MSVEDLNKVTVYTVTLDANGGTVPPCAMLVEQNGTYGILPRPVREGDGRKYEFCGWYTEREGGKMVWDYRKLAQNANHTLYAHWKEVEEENAASSGGLQNFTARNLYRNGLFQDVSESAWYADNVATVYQFGLMNGTGANTFDPQSNVTIAQAVTLAARVHSIYHTGKESFDAYDGGNWFDPYVNYARENGIISENYNYALPASREVFAHILAKALPESEMPSIRNKSIQFADAGSTVYAGDVELLCKAGVITGVQSDGVTKFLPNNTITRAEGAAIVTRMVKPELRK